MVATDVLDDDDVIYEVGADPVQNSVRPTLPLTNPILRNAMSSAEELSRRSMERKIQAGHIVNHHGAMQMFLANANLANVMRLTDEQKSHITPFPSPSNITLVQDGSNEKLIGVMGSLVDKLMDKVQPPVVAPTQPEKPDTQQSETTPAVVPSNIWSTVTKYSSPVAWTVALVSALASGYLAWNRPSEPSPPTPIAEVQQPALGDIEGTIGVTIE